MSLDNSGILIVVVSVVLAAVVIVIGVVVGTVVIPYSSVDYARQGAVGGVTFIDRITGNNIDTGVASSAPVAALINQGVAAASGYISQGVGVLTNYSNAAATIGGNIIGNLVGNITGNSSVTIPGASDLINSGTQVINGYINQGGSLINSATGLNTSSVISLITNATGGISDALGNATQFTWSGITAIPNPQGNALSWSSISRTRRESGGSFLMSLLFGDDDD